MIYTPQDWYWVVAQETNRLYSSRAIGYVPLDDAAYSAWRARGNDATHIVSEAELQDVLATQYPAGWPAA
ncbi:hypothetical protein HJG45_05550 [Roseicella sp. DB1501]|nr:hypothetical protein [Roseicella sp. DB1501]